MLKGAGVKNIVLGGSPCVASRFRKAVSEIEKDRNAWETIIRLEEKAYCLRTMVDNGEFLLAKGIKR